MRALRGIAGHLPLHRVVQSVEAVRTRLELVNAWLQDEEVAPAVELFTSMPRLRRLELLYTAKFEPILASPLWPRLEEMRYLDGVTVRREGKDLHLTLETSPTKFTRAFLDALPKKEVASLRVRGAITGEITKIAGAFPRVEEPVSIG
jgi:hypothetical protein